MFEQERKILEDLADLASIRESLAAIEAQNATIIANQERLMSEQSQTQADVDAATAAITNLTGIVGTWPPTSRRRRRTSSRRSAR